MPTWAWRRSPRLASRPPGGASRPPGSSRSRTWPSTPSMARTSGCWRDCWRRLVRPMEPPRWRHAPTTPRVPSSRAAGIRRIATSTAWQGRTRRRCRAARWAACCPHCWPMPPRRSWSALRNVSMTHTTSADASRCHRSVARTPPSPRRPPSGSCSGAVRPGSTRTGTWRAPCAATAAMPRRAASRTPAWSSLSGQASASTTTRTPGRATARRTSAGQRSSSTYWRDARREP